MESSMAVNEHIVTCVCMRSKANNLLSTIAKSTLFYDFKLGIYGKSEKRGC